MAGNKTGYIDGGAREPLLDAQHYPTPSAPPMIPPQQDTWSTQASMYAPPPPPPPTINVVQGVPFQPLPPAYPPLKPQGYNTPPPDPHAATLLPTPELLTCGHCASVVVPVRYKGSGLCTWLTCGALCGLGFWPCAPFVFCCSCTKDDIFQCPRCRCELGRDRFPRCLN